MPTLRRLAKEGARAEGISTVNPSVTWPNHTSMVTGVLPARHGVLFNGLPVIADGRPIRIEQWRPKDELVLAPTVYDLAFRAGLTTAEVDWVAITEAKTITWSFPERPNRQGKVEQKMIAAGLLTEDTIENFFRASPALRDQVWTDAAVFVITHHRPNLLLFHLLNVDALNHKFGLKSWASLSAYAYADACLARILKALEDAGSAGKTTVLVVSDHGFRNASRIIRPNARLAEMNIHPAGAQAISEGGVAMLCLRNPGLRDRLRTEFASAEGVERVVGPEEFERLSLPDPKQSARMSELLLVAKAGYSFIDAAGGPFSSDLDQSAYPGHHGYLSTDPAMNAVLVGWGYGIRRGASVGVLRNRDVAPTIAALLGLWMDGADGRVVDEMLDLPKQ